MIRELVYEQRRADIIIIVVSHEQANIYYNFLFQIRLFRSHMSHKLMLVTIFIADIGEWNFYHTT